MLVILCLLVLLFPQYIGEQNCAAVIAAPITAHSDMFTTCDVYKFCAFVSYLAKTQLLLLPAASCCSDPAPY
jgi:hypothetical protein